MTEREVPGGGDVLEDGWTGWSLLEESQEPRNNGPSVKHHQNAVPATPVYTEAQQQVPSVPAQNTHGLPAISSCFSDGLEEQGQSVAYCRIISSEVIDEGVSENCVPNSRNTGPDHPYSSYRKVPNVPIPVDSGGVEGPSQSQLLEDIDKLKWQISCYDVEMRLIKEKVDQLRLHLGAKMKELEMAKRGQSEQPNRSVVRHLYDPCINDQPAFHQMRQRDTYTEGQCNQIEFGNEEGTSGEPNSVADTSTILQGNGKRGRGRPRTRDTRQASAQRKWHKENYAKKKQNAKELKEMQAAQNT